MMYRGLKRFVRIMLDKEHAFAGALFWLALHGQRGRALAKCQDGWQNFTDHCYYVPEIKQPCEGAEITCVMHGAHLASINSEEERRFITDLIHSTRKTRKAWVGLYKHYTGSRSNQSLEERRQGWTWTDGSDVIDHVLNWATDEPSGLIGEVCARTDDGLRKDTSEHDHLHLVCKRKWTKVVLHNTTATTTTYGNTRARPTSKFEEVPSYVTPIFLVVLILVFTVCVIIIAIIAVRRRTQRTSLAVGPELDVEDYLEPLPAITSYTGQTSDKVVNYEDLVLYEDLDQNRRYEALMGNSSLPPPNTDYSEVINIQ